MNSYALLVLDSCRFDTMEYVWSDLRSIPRIGELRKAYSISTWTLTSHVAFAVGRLPWQDLRRHPDEPKQTLDDLRKWEDRLGVDCSRLFSSRRRFLDTLKSLGYAIKAVVAASPIGVGSEFQLLVPDLVSVGKHGATLRRTLTHLSPELLSFQIINTCETHYPYYDGSYSGALYNKLILPGFDAQKKAAVSGFIAEIFPSNKDLQMLLFERQCSAIKFVDACIPEFLDHLPKGCYLSITSDHGDCFGEGGFTGHGEVLGTPAFEVPIIEGRI